MDIETIIRTFLQKNPAIPAKFLIPKLREKTGLSRSTIYKHLDSLETRGLIYSEKGRYWSEKPTGQEKTSFLKEATDFLESRAKRKLLEKKDEKEELDLEIRRIRCRMQIRRMTREYYRTCPQKNRNEPVPLEVQADIEKKCRKQYGLSIKDPL